MELKDDHSEGMQKHCENFTFFFTILYDVPSCASTGYTHLSFFSYCTNRLCSWLSFERANISDVEMLHMLY